MFLFRYWYRNSWKMKKKKKRKPFLALLYKKHCNNENNLDLQQSLWFVRCTTCLVEWGGSHHVLLVRCWWVGLGGLKAGARFNKITPDAIKGEDFYEKELLLNVFIFRFSSPSSLPFLSLLLQRFLQLLLFALCLYRFLVLNSTLFFLLFFDKWLF